MANKGQHIPPVRGASQGREWTTAAKSNQNGGVDDGDSDDHAPQWLTVSEVAEELRVSVKTVLRWIRSRRLRAHRLGGQYRIHRPDLDDFVAAAAVE